MSLKYKAWVIESTILRAKESGLPPGHTVGEFAKYLRGLWPEIYQNRSLGEHNQKEKDNAEREDRESSE